MAASKAIGFLNFKFSADLTSFERAMNKAQKKLKKFGNQLQKTGKSMTMGLTLPIVGVGVASAKMSMDFDKSMTKVITLVGIAEDEVNSMRKSVLLLSDKTGIAAAEMAEGLFFLTSAGLRGANALETLEAVAKASASGLGDMEALSKVAAAAQNAYGVETLTAADALDTFAGMVKSGMFEANELSQVLGGQMGLASTLGISMEELGGFIATYTKTTGDATSATVGLEGVMMSFAKITPKQEKALGKINMTVEQLRKSLSEQGLQKTLIMMASKFKNAGVDLSEFFSKSSSLKGVLGVLGNQTETYIDILDDLSGAQGTVDDAFDRTSEMAGFQMTKSFNQLKNAGIEMGDALAPIILMISEKIQKLADWFSGLSKEQKDNVVQWGLILAAIGPVLIIVGKMSVGLGSLIGGFKKLAKWIVANPYLALAGAITLIVAQVARLIIQYDGLTSSQRAINNLNQTAASQILKQKTEVERLTDVLKDENTALEDKEIALKKLQGISPTYYGNMTAATLNVKQLDTATKDYISTLLTQAKIEAGQNLLVGLMEEQIQLSAEIAEANEEVSTGQMLLNIGKAIIMPGDALANQVNDYKDLKRFNELQKDITAITDLINTEEKKQQKQRETAATYEFKEIGSGDGDGGNAQEKLDSAQDTTIDKMENVTLALDDGTDAAKGLYGEFKKLEKTKPFEPLGELDKFAGSLGIFGDEMAIFFGTNIEAIESGLESMVTTLGDNLAQGAESFGEYAENVKGILRDIIGGLISSGVAAAVSKAITDAAFLPVWAIPVVAGAAAGLARTAFNTLIPEFAAGGLVTGPTTALIGEGSGTSMANPEVVAPLDKLKQYMGGGQNVTVQGRLVGSDIYLSNERTKFNRNRTV